jgi:hypothetical protein
LEKKIPASRRAIELSATELDRHIGSAQISGKRMSGRIVGRKQSPRAPCPAAKTLESRSSARHIARCTRRGFRHDEIWTAQDQDGRLGKSTTAPEEGPDHG